MDDLVRNEFRRLYCNDRGVQQGVVNLGIFRQHMYDSYPTFQKDLKSALKKFINQHSNTYCDGFPQDENGEFLDHEAALAHLRSMRRDMDEMSVIRIWDGIRARNCAAARARNTVVQVPVNTGTSTTRRPAVPQPTSTSSNQPIQPVQSSSTIQQFVPTNYIQPSCPTPPVSLPGTPPAPGTSDADTFTQRNDILAKKLKQLQLSVEDESRAQIRSLPSAQKAAPDFSVTGKLLKVRRSNAAGSVLSSAAEESISQAPLLTAGIVAEHYKDLVPQYGLLGSLEDGLNESANPHLFLNTNVPFSAFICGVQGSGKSHTTSCILENAILASSSIGHLESPASTLVFSYGEWSSGGAAFNVSEATFLGASHPDFPDLHVKRVTVLYSPSNPAIKRMYERLPNVNMVPFRLKARSLDIAAIHTLMAVNDKSTTPLYMATVEAILRDIAFRSADGSMDYLEFKRRISEERFDSTQINMLNMRMNLLESFLDLDGTAPVPDFTPGEITVIDLSDAFLTPSTACILFKLGLEHFLQSNSPSKLVVLDEAHKYMLDTAGSKVLTDYLTKVIRLQRHQGARVVISTQEPTIATDLIALCSVTIMHRFTSPSWYAALRKHINAVDGDREIMQRIEALETGEALVYSPNAVLGKNEDGSLVKAIGRLMRINVRNRVTLDGGASIMAV